MFPIDLPPNPSEYVYVIPESAKQECPQILKNILSKKKYQGIKREGPIRNETIKRESYTAGAQRGMYSRAKHIYDLLKKLTPQLDKIYDFVILRNGKVMPPVITEAQRTFKQSDDGQQSRTAERTWEIIVPARITAAPPVWQDYLMPALDKPVEINPLLLPRSSDEKTVWENNFCVGFEDGYQQADLMFQENVNRITRDYIGMLRYKELEAQKIISESTYEENQLGVTKDGKKLHVDDRIQQITKQSEWMDPRHWKTNRERK